MKNLKTTIENGEVSVNRQMSPTLSINVIKADLHEYLAWLDEQHTLVIDALNDPPPPTVRNCDIPIPLGGFDERDGSIDWSELP